MNKSLNAHDYGQVFLYRINTNNKQMRIILSMYKLDIGHVSYNL